MVGIAYVQGHVLITSPSALYTLGVVHGTSINPALGGRDKRRGIEHHRQLHRWFEASLGYRTFRETFFFLKLPTGGGLGDLKWCVRKAYVTLQRFF